MPELGTKSRVSALSQDKTINPQIIKCPVCGQAMGEVKINPGDLYWDGPSFKPPNKERMFPKVRTYMCTKCRNLQFFLREKPQT